MMQSSDSPPDGNCQFAAMAAQFSLHNITVHAPHTFATVRHKIIEYWWLCYFNNPQWVEYMSARLTKISLYDYIVRMSNNREWGDEATLHAASQVKFSHPEPAKSSGSVMISPLFVLMSVLL